MTEGRVRRAYIGIAGGPRPLPPQARSRLGRKDGVEVVEVVEGSPAERAGLRAEDLIVELDGRPIERVDDVQRLMTGDAIGQPVAVQVLRGDRLLELEIRPEELSELATLGFRRPGGVRSTRPRSGRHCPEDPEREARRWPVEMSGSLRLLRVKSASAATTRPTRANGTTRSGYSCASTAAGAGATPLTARRAELTGAVRGSQSQTREGAPAQPRQRAAVSTAQRD